MENKFSIDKVKKDAEKLASEFGYNVTSISPEVVNVKDAFCIGYNKCLKDVQAVLKETSEACKNLTDEDKIRSAQEIINETYEDMIAIFQPLK